MIALKVVRRPAGKIWRKRLWVAAAILAAGAALRHSSIGTFLEVRQAWRDEARLESDIDRLKQENARYEEEIEGFEENGPIVTRRAREVLGFARPGEVIVKIPEKK